VDAVACRAHDPFLELAIGVGQITEVTQGHEIVLDVFDAGFHDALFLRISGRAGGDEEAVSLGDFGIGPLDLGIIVAGFGDGVLGVVDDHFRRYAAEELEGPAVATQPGLDFLIPDDLGVLVAAPGQGHDENPGVVDLARGQVHALRPGTKVNLGHLLGFVVEHYRGRGPFLLLAAQESFHRVIAAGKSVSPHQGVVDRRGLNALLAPSQDLLGVWENQGLRALNRRPASQAWRHVADRLRGRCPKLAKLMDESEHDVLAYMTFPAQHRVKLHSTNPLERLNKEVKRRANVVGIFPKEQSIIRLIGAILQEQNDEWQLQSRYMQVEDMAELNSQINEVELTQIPPEAA